MKSLILPNLLLNSVYVRGLDQPLKTVAEILDEQGLHHYASAIRDAAHICEVFADVNLDKVGKIKV